MSRFHLNPLSAFLFPNCNEGSEYENAAVKYIRCLGGRDTMGLGSLYKIFPKDELVGLVTNDLFTSSVKSIRDEPKACTSDLPWKLSKMN